MKQVRQTKRLMISLLVLIAIAIGLQMLTQPLYFENDKGLFTVENSADQVSIVFDSKVTRVRDYEVDSEVFIEAYTTRLDKLLNRQTQISKTYDPDFTIFYNNHTRTADRIHGTTGQHGYATMLGALALYVYRMVAMFIMGALAVILFFVHFVFKRKVSLMTQGAVLGFPLTFLIASFAVKGLSGVSHHFVRDLLCIGVTWLLLYLFLLISIRYYNLSRQ